MATLATLATNKQPHPHQHGHASPALQHPLSPKKPRPARSNSLQRMLELEKQCMLDRRHAHKADPNPDPAPAAAPPVSPTGTGTKSPSHAHPKSSSTSRPTIPRRQLPSSATAKQDYKPALQTRQQQHLQHPYELPPIDTDFGIAIDAGAFGIGASNPASPETMRDSNAPHNARGRGQTTKAERPITAQPSSPPVGLPSPPLQDISLQDRREMCQSPSWDAYSRRKKEKKEQEQASKEAKAKKRRLSKAPPPSPSLQQHPQAQAQPNKAGPYPPSSRRDPGLAQAQTDACMSDSHLARPRQQKERPASAAGLSSPHLPLPLPGDIPAARQARGRSSSISSLFRRRRSSVDQADSGFIGGIKLEHRRLEANQKELNDHAVASDDIAPPRKHADKRSPSPLRIFAPRSPTKDKQDRSYPPIAIRTSGKNAAFLAPESPAEEDGKMGKSWRAIVGLKGSKDNKEKGHKLTKTPSAQKEGLKSVPLPRSESAPLINSPTVVQRYRGPIDDEKMGMLGQFDPSAHPVFNSNSAKLAKESNNIEHPDEAVNSGSEESYNTVPESPPPPPRRSSKRKSLISLGDATSMSSPQLSSHSSEPHDNQKATAVPPEPKRPAPGAPSQLRPKPSAERVSRPLSERWSMSNPPSIAYESLEPTASHGHPHSKKTWKEATKAAFGRHGLPSPTMPAAASDKPIARSRSPARGPKDHSRTESANAATNSPGSKSARVLGLQEWRISAPIRHSPPDHSSEDSSSDDFRSPSEHDTPDSSRAHSDRDGFLTSGDKEGEHARAHDSGYASAHPSPAFSHADARHSNQPSPLELDPIQAAALKVMAAFPDVTPRRPGVDRRASSDPSVAQPKGKQPLQARDASRPRPIKTSIEPVHDPESKSPPLRDLLMLKDEASAAAPWPATYLEAARKAAPTAPPPKILKQGSSPPSISCSKNSPSLRPRPNPEGEPVAKMFVECCGCKYYHDMPSKLYEFMAHPQDAITLGNDMHFAGSVSMTVKCPWCKHEMSTKCCAGLAAMVYVKERLH